VIGSEAAIQQPRSGEIFVAQGELASPRDAIQNGGSRCKRERTELYGIRFGPHGH